MDKRFFLNCIIFFLFLFLSGCNNNEQAKTDNNSNQEIGYSNTGNENFGSISGIILLSNNPVVEASIYLGDVLNDENGNPLATSVDRSNAPFALTDERGFFNINNVPEGQYGLMFSNSPEVYLLLYPNEEKAIIVDIIVGKDFYLGELDYSDLPLN